MRSILLDPSSQKGRGHPPEAVSYDRVSSEYGLVGAAYRVNFILDIALLRRIANCFEISRMKSQNWADATSICLPEPADDTYCRRARSRMIVRHQSQQASALQPQRRVCLLGVIV